MKPKIVALVVALVALAVVAWSATTPARGDKPPSVAQPGDAGNVAPAADPRLAALQRSPQARVYRDRQAFEAGSKRFLRDAAKLGPVERAQQARELSASIDKYEREGGLSAGEALLLRSALVKATVADETRQGMQIADLMQGYRERADQGMADYLARHQRDPRFQDYKAQERSIVAEVMAMRSIPGGLSRNEYLRQRLQQAREAAYGK